MICLLQHFYLRLFPGETNPGNLYFININKQEKEIRQVNKVILVF